MYRPRKVDDNAKDIVSDLRRMGISVTSLHRVGWGCPDIICGAFGKTILVEIKQKGKILSPSQQDWIKLWNGGKVIVATCVEDVMNEFLK